MVRSCSAKLTIGFLTVIEQLNPFDTVHWLVKKYSSLNEFPRKDVSRSRGFFSRCGHFKHGLFSLAKQPALGCSLSQNNPRWVVFAFRTTHAKRPSHSKSLKLGCSPSSNNLQYGRFFPIAVQPRKGCSTEENNSP